MANGQFAIRLLTLALALSLALSRVSAQQPNELQITALDLGFSGAYKLGCWTQAEVTLAGGDEPFTALVEITVRDPEGVTSAVITPPDRAVAVLPGQPTTARLFVRPGQDGAAIQVRVLDEGGRPRAKRNFYPGQEIGDDIIRYGLPATNRIFASFGSRRGVNELVRGEATDENQMAVRAVNVTNAADLPLEWYGYEAIDTLVLSSSRPALYRSLAASQQRIDALVRWVELGGRVVIFCGANAPELIGPGGPLAALVPGKYDTLAPLREMAPIEAFANAETTVTPGRLTQIQVPRLTDVRGQILAFAGQNAADLPLVIRARHGLGEVTFVGIEPDAPPIADWSGRANLLRQALQWPAEEQDRPTGQQEDLMDRVRRALDGSFVDVRTAPFALVALLVILYILLIGPGDYFFVKRVLKRMELTWLTFPLIVFAVSAAAYWAAHYMKGDKLRVNQVEIVDVDLATGQARGTVWTHFFSPRVNRYNLTLAPRFGNDEVDISEPGRPGPGARNSSSSPPASSLQPPASLVGWLGSTGYALDGMQGRRSQPGLFETGYAFSPNLDALVGMPVQEWSTRTLIGRWSAELVEPIDAQLQDVGDNLLTGRIANRTGVDLEGCLLMHGNWAYRVPDLKDGAEATIDESAEPIPVRSALTASQAGYEIGGSPAEVASAKLESNSTDIDRLALAMMFNEASGGITYSQTPNRYQSFIDLSRLLTGDQAILLARPKAAASNWTDGETSLASDKDRHWLYYRFVIPLEESE